MPDSRFFVTPNISVERTLLSLAPITSYIISHKYKSIAPK